MAALLLYLVALAGAVSAGAQCVTFTTPASFDAQSATCGSIVPLAVLVPGDTEFLTGCEQHYVLHAGDGTRGEWGYLQFSPCLEGSCASRISGGAAGVLECQLASGDACLGIFQLWVRMLTGVRRGALRDGLGARFSRDTDQRSRICFADYQGNGARVINVPIVRAYGDPPHVGKIQGFATFFLSGLPADGDSIEGQFLHYLVPGCCGAPER